MQSRRPPPPPLGHAERVVHAARGVVSPFFAYSHADKVVAGESCPAGSSSISGLAFYNGGAYSSAYNGALFFADYSRNCIWVMFPAASLPDPTTRTTFVAGASGPVDLKIGSGGDLFYVDFNGGTIRRIRYTAGNHPPTAAIQAAPLSGPPPLTVSFDGGGSIDPDPGDTLTYSWDLNGDGVFGDATTAQTTFTYTAQGRITASLRVTDSHGASDTETVVILVGTPPTATIEAPLATLTWKVGDTINFSGYGTDLEDGTVPASALSWAWILRHCAPNCHTHPLQTFTGVASGSFPAADHEYSSYLELRLTATDSVGLTDTKSVLLYPKTVDLSFQSSPSGLQLVVGSSSAATPFTRTVIQGSSNSLSAPSPQTLGGTTYAFSSWSDGGAQTHNIVASAPQSYVATYTAPPDTTPPTAPSNLSATAVSSSQLNLTWTASTDNVGVVGYRLERYQGNGCNNFTQIATPTVQATATPGYWRTPPIDTASAPRMLRAT